ncbi:MAG: LemA family protein [Magnetococcales bacterium]|nr:LemA family protein [Magnetococcales bacterium]
MSDKNDPMDEMDDLGLEMTSSERMQRMRKLMRQLYQEEEATHAMTLPPIKSKSLILVSSISAIVFLIVTTFYNFNRFVAAEEQVLSARGHIHDALQRRSNLFGNLVNLTLNHAMLEQEVFRYVSDGRLGMMGQSTPSGQKSPSAQSGETNGSQQPASANPTVPPNLLPSDALARLFGLVEQYPDIKTSTTYQQLMDKLMDIENKIAERRDEYNTDVKFYNTLITTFPWSIMARILGFNRFDYFRAEAGPDNLNMDLDSRKFMRLIPEQELTNPHHKDQTRSEHKSPSAEANKPAAMPSLPLAPVPMPVKPAPGVPGNNSKGLPSGAVVPETTPPETQAPTSEPMPQPQSGKRSDAAVSGPGQGHGTENLETESRKNMRLISENRLTNTHPTDGSKPEDGEVRAEDPVTSTDKLDNGQPAEPNRDAPAAASRDAKGKSSAVTPQKTNTQKPPSPKGSAGAPSASKGNSPSSGTSSKSTNTAASKVAVAVVKPDDTVITPDPTGVLTP